MYTEWRKDLDREAREELQKQSIPWDDMTKLSQRISNLVKSNVDSPGVDIKSKFYDPVTGLHYTFGTMNEWNYTVRKIYSICVDDDGHLFECPGEVIAGRRWLRVHEGAMVLLFTILALYEGPYKKVIDLLYDMANGRNPEKTSTDTKANHLATKYGIDVRYAMRPDLRHAAAHMSFRPNADSGKVLIRFKKDGTETDRLYTREKLVSVYTEMRDAILLLYDAVLYWWKTEYGATRLFDDVFYSAENGGEVRREALAVLRPPHGFTTEVWKEIVETFRLRLIPKPS